MARIKLTIGRIRDFSCPVGKAQAFLWDTEAPGLAVRATPGSDVRAFIFQGLLNGKYIRTTIGDSRAWNLDDARAEARRLQNLIDQGTDPRQEKAERIATTEAKREEARREKVLALDAWSAYVEARKPRWSESHYAAHLKVAKEGGETITRGRKVSKDGKTLPGNLRPLLDLPLNQIDAERVQAWLKADVEQRPTQASLTFRLLRTFIRWCSEHSEYRDQVHQDACAGRAVREELPKKVAKQDVIERDMLRPWFEQVRKLSNPIHAAYLQTVLLTGARPGEVVTMRWEDVDFQWGSLIIRDKVEGERTIPLTPYVASLLQDLKRRNDTPPTKFRILHGKRIENDLDARTPSPWVFASKIAASGYLQEPRIAHQRAVKAAGLPNITIHGLRRSFGSLSEWCEVPAGVVAQIQGHKPSATAERHYRVRPLDLLRQWHTKIEGWILEQAGIELPNQEEAAPSLRMVG